MSGIGATPVDGTSGGGIPLSCVESPGNTGQTSGGNVIPVPLQGHDGSYLDSSQNPTTAAMMAYLFPRIVQKAHNVTGSAGKTLTCAFTNNNNYGNSIVVCVGLGEVEAANITLAITDSNSNTYTEAVKASQSTTLESAIFYAINIAAGVNTITVTIAGSSSTNEAIAVEIYEVWGTIALAGALDQTSTGSNAGSTSPSTGAIVPVAPNELCFAAIAAAGGTITAGTGFNLDSTSLSPMGGNLVSFGSESQTLTTFASITPGASLSASNAWAMCAATFKSVIVPIEGTVTALQGTSPWVDNLTQVGGSAIALGQTTMSASLPVTIASNQGAVPTQTQVGTSGGSTPYHNVVSSGTNGTNVKNSAGQVYDGVISNTSSSAVYFRFYDTNSAPTVGTSTVKRTMQVPGNGTVIFSWPNGLRFTSGISWGITTAIGDSDTTAISASVSIDFGYD